MSGETDKAGDRGSCAYAGYAGSMTTFVLTGVRE